MTNKNIGQCLRRFNSLLLAALLISVSINIAADEHADVLDGWSSVLANYVDDKGRTDFTGLAENMDELEAFVTYLANHGPDTEPTKYGSTDKKLAFHINAYNALAMYGVIDAGIPKGFNSILKRARFFKFRKILIDGERMSLSAYENDVIRPLGEPRVHFALNCMVKDCPRLPQEPFSAELLDQQLNAATVEFFNHEKHLMRLAEKQQVVVSKILDFYTKDFVPSGRRHDLITYINRYLEEPIPTSWSVTFMDYDWTINQRPPQNGQKVTEH